MAGLGSPFCESSPVAGGPRQLPSEFLKVQPADSDVPASGCSRVTDPSASVSVRPPATILPAPAAQLPLFPCWGCMAGPEGVRPLCVCSAHPTLLRPHPSNPFCSHSRAPARACHPPSPPLPSRHDYKHAFCPSWPRRLILSVFSFLPSAPLHI